MTYLAVRARVSQSAFIAVAVAACLAATDVNPAAAQGFGRARSNLTGTYRLNTSQSDNSSDIADQVTRSLPGRDRPRLRNQILQRLESPGDLAIERRGRT